MVGMQIGFLPRPIVVRDKSNQNIQDEFTSEMMQYVKSVALIKFLKKWSTMEKGIRYGKYSPAWYQKPAALFSVSGTITSQPDNYLPWPKNYGLKCMKGALLKFKMFTSTKSGLEPCIVLGIHS